MLILNYLAYPVAYPDTLLIPRAILDRGLSGVIRCLSHGLSWIRAYPLLIRRVILDTAPPGRIVVRQG